MTSSLLADSLQAFSEEDWQAFHQFTESPAHNRSDRLRRLCQWLYQHRAAVTEAIDSFELSQAPDDAPHQKRNLLARCSTLVREFLAWQALSRDQDLLDLLALSRFRELNAGKSFDTLHHRIRKRLDTAPVRDSEHFRKKWQLESEANGMYGIRQQRVQDDHLQLKMEALDRWYLSVKFKESCEMSNRERVLNQHFHNDFLETLTEEMDRLNHPAAEESAIRMYRTILTVMESDRPEDIEILISDLGIHGSRFHPEELRGMYKHAQNACIRRINQGDAAFLEVLFRLYQRQLDSGLLTLGETINHSDVKNISTVAIRLGEFDWCRNVLTAVAPFIPDAYRENVVEFSLASLELEEGHPHEAIRRLQAVAFSDVFYDLSARHLLLKCWTSLEDWESCQYAIQAFEVFLRRNKQVPRETRDAHVHFLRILKKVVAWKDRSAYESPARQQKRVSAIRDQLTTLQPLAHREWL